MNYDRWYYPVALAELAAVAHAANHEVRIYDGDKYFDKDLTTSDRSILLRKEHVYYDNVDNFEHNIWQHFRQAFEDFDPEIIGVSVYTCKLKSAINTLKLVREFKPAIKTCVGGAHVTAVPETLISKNYIDGVFVGHADLIFPEWIADGCPKGIIRGDSSKIEPEKLLYSRRQSLLFPEYYTSEDLGMMTVSRGCLGRCTFCSESFMSSGKPKYRTSASIITELTELLEEWKTGRIFISAPAFGDIPEESKRIAGILKDFGVSWQTNLRWHNITRELLEYFISCGCYQIHVGLESGSDKILHYVKKGCNRRLIKEKAQLIESLGIKLKLCSIVGFPIETIEDMKETMELALEISPTSMSLNSFSPLPGTNLYKSIPGITPEIASMVNQLHPNYCFSKNMDIETYTDIFEKMTKVVDDYNSKKTNQ